MSVIKMSGEALDAKKVFFDGKRDEVDALMNQVAAAVGELSGEFTGDAATAFEAQMNAIRERPMAQMRDIMQEVGKQLMDIKTLMETTDQETAAIINQGING